MESLSPTFIALLIVAYFMILIVVAYFTKGSSDNKTFFSANKDSHWFLVAFGMIGASLSGVTFISIPGVVGGAGTNMAFSYMQVVFGYLIGYFIIASVLMPIYYKYNLTTIYGYLEQRFNTTAYKTASAYFLLSRMVGSALRLYLVALVLDKIVFTPLGLSFEITVAVTIFLIWVYTFQGGIKTIVVTDTLQTTFMILAVVMTIILVGQELQWDIAAITSKIQHSDYSKMWFFEGGWNDPNNFWKQLLSGALIALVMTGLDQDMMQKNLTCRNLKDAQKNMFTFSIILVVVNLMFLSLGALLYLYAAEKGITIPEKTDQFYAMIAMEHLPGIIGILFILGLIAAAYSSADSALTALTTAFCVDFLEIEKSPAFEKTVTRKRVITHLAMSVIMILVIIIFYTFSSGAVINQVFVAAGFTYGPILGLFSFAILTKRQLPGTPTIVVCIAAPVLSYFINANAGKLLNGFEFGNIIIALNGLLSFIGLYLISYKKQ